MSSSRRREIPKQQEQLRADTAERLAAIVEAAERAAERVIDDAEAQARRYLVQARAEADRLAEDRLDDALTLIESLVGQAASLRLEAERLQQALETAQARFGGEGDADPGLERSRPPRLRAVAEQDTRETAPDDRDRAAGARLLATQLAVSGSSREEIAARLRNGFEIEDANAILDAILGPEE
jgi:cell division septum initiation protein DivIVA